MWGGHFEGSAADIMRQVNASIGFDQRLYFEDIIGSRAHVSMLASTGIIPKEDAEAIQQGLAKVQEEIEKGAMVYDDALEDIHMHIEARLAELIGDAAGRMHTARSRNDQVATDFRLWVRAVIDRLERELALLQKALLSRAEEHADTVMPGFTHLQAAQPVIFGHHLLAYVEMLGRDRGRLADCRKRLNECPLGAAALAGTSFPIDREQTSDLLGFDRPTANSMDSVSDRDFAMEFLSALSILMTHLSRLAEEMVFWSSAQFKFITLSDAFTTGSSIMPQKRNPDAAELVRGKTGRVFGALTALLTTMKGLPLTYSKDMQEDKEPVFDAADTAMICVKVMTGMVGDMTVHPAAMRAATENGFPTATDLADWLVRKLGMPFRRAHHVTGQAVRLAEQKQCRLDALSLEELQAIEPGITQEIFDVLAVDASVSSRKSFGGTAPERVRASVEDARNRFGLSA